MQEQLEIKNSYDELLDARLHLPEETTNKCAIILHGIHSDKNLIWFYQIAECLASQGFAACRFDFSGHGDSEGDFAQFTFAKGSSDLISVIEGLKERGYDEFAIIGHSLGGAVSLITVPDHPEVKCLVEIASPACPYRNANEDFLRNMYEELDIEDGALLSEVHHVQVLDQVKKIQIPTLVIHGDKDKIIPINEGQKIFDALSGEKEIKIIEGGDHVLLDFSKDVVSAVCSWVTKYL